MINFDNAALGGLGHEIPARTKRPWCSPLLSSESTAATATTTKVPDTVEVFLLVGPAS